MKKNTGKVLSLVLAMAMAASTFTATFASAATLEVDTDDARASWAEGEKPGSELVSDKYKDIVLVDNLDDAVELETMNREGVDEVEYLGFTKTGGDSLLRVVRSGNDNDEHSLVLRKGASGTEDITISYRGTYVDDETDRDVTVRGSVTLSITVYTQGEVMVGEPGVEQGSHPSAPDLLAVNDSGMELSLYVADYATGTKGTPAWKAIDPYGATLSANSDDLPYDEDSSNVIAGGIARLSSAKIFNIKDAEDDQAEKDAEHVVGYNGTLTANYASNDKELRLPLIRDDEDSGRWYADPATTTLELYAPKVTVEQAFEDDGTTLKQSDVKVSGENKTEVARGERLRVTVGVGRIWQLGNDYNTDDSISEDQWSTVARIGSRTVIGSNPSADDKWSDLKGYVKVISNYDIRGGGDQGVNSITIESGNLGTVKVDSITINGGNIDTADGSTVSVAEANVDTVKGSASVRVDTDSSVGSVSGGTVEIQGATVSGDVSGTDVTISGDIDYKTSIGGDVSAEADLTITGSEDEPVTVAGMLKADEDNTAFDVSGLGVSIGGVATDWRETEMTFNEFVGAFEIASTETGHAVLNLENDADVTVTNNTYLASISVDETSTLTFEGTVKVEDLAGDGLVKVNPDSLFIKGGLDGVKIQLLGNPAVGDVVLRSTVDTVASEDINGVGFTTTLTHENSTTDRFTIDEVSFAGLAFAEPSVEVSVGTTETIQIEAYPSGTTLPGDYAVRWDFNGDDEYIVVTPAEDQSGTATVEVLKFNPDYAYSNRAVVTATLVDADGYEVEGLVPATCTIYGTDKPASTVTLDTTTVTRQVGQIYQFIASSTAGGTITAASSDAAVATVALYDANDARGHKFQINAVGVGTATITATDVNGATASLTITVTESTGSLKMDTTAYTMAPGGIYDILVTVEGADVEPEVTISRDAIASLTALGEGKYRVTARNEGTTYVTATVTVNGVEYHTSVQINVVAGATASGVTGNNVTYFA